MKKEALLEPLLRKLRIGRIINYIPENAFICDVGCGFDGTFLKQISYKIAKGIGLDKKVTPYSDEKINLIRCEMEDSLNLDSYISDCITMLAVLEHLDHPKAILEECFRVLKSGGVLIITTPTPLSKYILEFMAFRLRIISKQEILDHKYYFKHKEIKEILENIGFSKVIATTFQFGLNNFVIAYK